MQEKWNQFVYYLREAKKNGVEEPEYHSTIEAQLQLVVPLTAGRTGETKTTMNLIFTGNNLHAKTKFRQHIQAFFVNS
jgi:hypothetical protein